MKVTATLDGNSVTIANIEVQGSTAYITYADGSGNLKITKKNVSLAAFGPSTDTTIATGATVVS